MAITELDLGGLDRVVSSLLGQGIAPSTAAAYRSGMRQYLSFCTCFKLTPLPVSQAVLCRFVAWLHTRNLSPSSTQQYLSAVRYYQIMVGGPDPSLSDMPQLHYILTAVRRTQPIHTRPSRLPVTPDVLTQLYTTWSSPPVSPDAHMLWAACCLGFFAFLRSGEFTCPSLAAYSPAMLSPRDIQVDDHANPTCVFVTLRSSKTDIFGRGQTLCIGSTGNHLCPVAALLSYLALQTPGPGTLFVYQSGQLLSRQSLVHEVRRALVASGRDLSRYNGHSFRIGAATTAAVVGLPDSLIQALGRWRSSAFLRYIRTPQDQLAAVSHQLVSM